MDDVIPAIHQVFPDFVGKHHALSLGQLNAAAEHSIGVKLLLDVVAGDSVADSRAVRPVVRAISVAVAASMMATRQSAVTVARVAVVISARAKPLVETLIGALTAVGFDYT